jgi:hypothetical protein
MNYKCAKSRCQSIPYSVAKTETIEPHKQNMNEFNIWKLSFSVSKPLSFVVPLLVLCRSTTRDTLPKGTTRDTLPVGTKRDTLPVGRTDRHYTSMTSLEVQRTQNGRILQSKGWTVLSIGCKYLSWHHFQHRQNNNRNQSVMASSHQC